MRSWVFHRAQHLQPTVAVTVTMVLVHAQPHFSLARIRHTEGAILELFALAGDG